MLLESNGNHYLRETLNLYQPRRSLRSTEDSQKNQDKILKNLWAIVPSLAMVPESGIHFQKESGILIKQRIEKAIEAPSCS